MPHRQRTVVTTDPELDDLNSMLRLLLYSNEIDIEALVYTSSQFHFAGDVAAALSSHRWPPEAEPLHIHQAIAAYEEVYSNLLVHDDRYPHPDQLRARTAEGNIRAKGDVSTPTRGSRLIERAILSKDPRRLFLQNWGGMNTTARALMSIEERGREEPNWSLRKAEISARLVLTSFAEQDDLYRDYIGPVWPDIEFRDVSTQAWGYLARRVVDEEGGTLLSADWMRKNVSEVGPMGAAYRVWGDGKQMSPGDREDYFGYHGLTVEQLEERGYWVWAPLEEPGSWISEGDSSNFAPLITNGLRAHEDAMFGGWGGRLLADCKTPGRFGGAEAPERRADGTCSEGWSTARWIPDLQRDFAARLQWSVTYRFEDANHPPVLTPTVGPNLSAAPGDEVQLAIRAEDPDGDRIEISWWQYPEAGTSQCEVTVRPAQDGLGACVRIPEDATAGESIHVLATGRDAGTPSLAGYARFVLTVL